LTSGYRYANGNVDATLPADATYFRIPVGIRWLILAFAIAFLAFLIFGVVGILGDRQHVQIVLLVLYVAVFGSLEAAALQMLFRALDAVAVNSEGIWYVPRKGGTTFIGWGDVASVRALDVRQRLVVTDTTGGKKIRLEYQLENFERLRTFVLEHSATARQHAPLNTVFHRNWVNRGVMLAFFGFFSMTAVCAAIDGVPVTALLLFGLAIPPLISLINEVASVQISNDSITIRYLGWQRSIPFQAITNIGLVDLHSRGDVIATVLIERRSGKPVRLMGFREGSVALNDALCSAWRAATTAGGQSPWLERAR
jgi:hypothetical protein